jgi:hypothetical protein
MSVQEIIPDVDRALLLDGADFADAFRIVIAGAAIDAREAAMRMLARPPLWVDGLITLRNLMVAPFGLKSSGADDAGPRGSIGIFPVVSETPQRLVVGFDDHHLDFRAVIDIASSCRGQQVTATTLVRTHNRLGRAYLALIMPFHRLIVRDMLRRVAR